MRKATHASRWALNTLLCFFLLVISCKKENEPAPPKEETPELTEVAKAKTGAILTPKEDYEKITLYVPKTFAGGRVAATTSADLTSLMPPIGNQDQQGSCNAFATAYAMKSYLDHIEKKTSYTNSDGSINYASIASPAYVYNQINNGQDRGSRPESAFRLMQSEGVCSWQDMPYNWKDYLSQPSAQQKARAASNKLYGWGRTVISTENFKSCLQEGLPIYIVSRVLSLKGTGPASPLVWNIYDESIFSLYHAMVIVGFDDNIKAFKVMNSWGTFWGNQGFSWMSYDLVKNGITESYIAFSKSMEPKLTEYKEQETYSGEGVWTKKADLIDYNVPVNARFIIGDTVYFVGNTGAYTDHILLTYHPKTNTWGSKGKILGSSSKIDQIVVESGGFVLSGRGYLMCKSLTWNYDAGKRLVEYDPAKNAWAIKKPFDKDGVYNKNEYSRREAPMFAYQGKGYYGLDASSLGDPSSRNQKAGELWEYEPSSDSWSLKAQLPIEWCTGGAESYGLIGSKLRMVYNDLYPRRLKNVYYPVYDLDLDTGKWTEGIPLNLKLVRTVGGILNGRHYAGLGLSGDVNLKRNTYLYYFDNATSKWVGVAPVPVNKDSKEQQASSFIYNNRLYVIYKDSDKKYQLWEYKP